jgi:hypothetical protein
VSSRWEEAELSAEKFVRLFIHYYVRAYGIPTAIVTDRDIRFQCAFWEAFTMAVGTKCKFSTAFHPETDGLAEKANDMVQIFLRGYATADLNNCDADLSLAEFTYNATRYKVTRVVPFGADLSYIPRLPIDFLIDPTSACHKGTLEAHNFIQKIDTHLRIVREHLEEAQDQMATAANEHRRAHSFLRGDKILINTLKFLMSLANIRSSSWKL